MFFLPFALRASARFGGLLRLINRQNPPGDKLSKWRDTLRHVMVNTLPETISVAAINSQAA
jgi:hypothetical protein